MVTAWRFYRVTIGNSEVWGIYRSIAHALQACRALRSVGFRPRIRPATLQRILWPLAAVEELR